MVGWHHQFNGHEFGQTLGDSEGQGRLVCCSPWGRKVRQDLMTEQQEGSEIGKSGENLSQRSWLCIFVGHTAF